MRKIHTNIRIGLRTIKTAIAVMLVIHVAPILKLRRELLDTLRE